MIIMKQFKNMDGEDFEVISSTQRCIQCRFQCKTVLKECKKLNISCMHPKGPGNPEHCIYFKRCE